MLQGVADNLVGQVEAVQARPGETGVLPQPRPERVGALHAAASYRVPKLLDTLHIEDEDV